MLVNRMININIGKKMSDEDEAEWMLAWRCSLPISGDLSTITANIMAYKMTTVAKHSKIHEGINTTSQDQLMKLSSLSAIKTIWRMLMAAKNSSSIFRPFLTDHTQTVMESSDINNNGTKASVQVCLFVSSLSQTKSSNMSSNSCSDRDMSIDLKCT